MEVHKHEIEGKTYGILSRASEVSIAADKLIKEAFEWEKVFLDFLNECKFIIWDVLDEELRGKIPEQRFDKINLEINKRINHAFAHENHLKELKKNKQNPMFTWLPHAPL